MNLRLPLLCGDAALEVLEKGDLERDRRRTGVMRGFEIHHRLWVRGTRSTRGRVSRVRGIAEIKAYPIGV